jgi:hypothetical protein
VPKLRKGFWFYLPVALLAWFAPVTSAKADALGNWTFSESNPCGGYVEVVNNSIILHGPDGNGCSGQAHWVKIETTIPANVDTIDFTWAYQTNDGWWYDPPQYAVNGVYTLLTQQNNATGSLTVPVNEGDIFTFRQYSVDTCCQPGHLTISNLSLWNGISQTTITSSTTTTTSSTTTSSTTTSSSVPQTTSTESSTTTTALPETSTSTSSTSTTVPQSSTTLVENTTSTTTTSIAPYVPEEVVEVPTGTTTTVVEEPTPEEMLPEETTTTTEPEPTTTELDTTTTEPYPETTVEETTTTTISDSIITPEEVAAVVEELATITEITPEVLSQVVDALNSDNITEEQVQAIVDAVVENLDTLTEITPEVLDQVINVLESDNITQEQVQKVVDTILATDISSDQATQLATSAAVLENVTGDQATEIFATIDTGELTGEQAAAIVEAVQEAPTEVREAFEAEINVFEGGFDNYIPTDSVVSVGVRRVVVAATTVSFILPAPVVSRRRR